MKVNRMIVVAVTLSVLAGHAEEPSTALSEPCTVDSGALCAWTTQPLESPLTAFYRTWDFAVLGIWFKTTNPSGLIFTVR